MYNATRHQVPIVITLPTRAANLGKPLIRKVKEASVEQAQ